MSTIHFETGLAVDGYPVLASHTGHFYTVVNGETIGASAFDRLEAAVASHLSELAAKREIQRKQAARRAVGKVQVWTRKDVRGHLEQATFRGYHATTGTPLLTFADGSKPIGKKHYALYTGLEQEQVDTVNGLIDADRAAGRAVEAQAGRAVPKSRLSAAAKDGQIVVTRDRYSSHPEEAARLPFSVHGKVLSVEVNGIDVRAETMPDLKEMVLCLLHPAYERLVWIVDERISVLLPEPQRYLGDDRLHDPDDQGYSSSLKIFEDDADAEGYLRLKKEREAAGQALRDALTALPRLERDEDDDEGEM